MVESLPSAVRDHGQPNEVLFALDVITAVDMQISVKKGDGHSHHKCVHGQRGPRDGHRTCLGVCMGRLDVFGAI